jgi:hypothetical protein
VAADFGVLGRRWLWASAFVTISALVAGVLLAPPTNTPAVGALVWLLFVGSSAHVAATAYLFTVPAVRVHVAGHRAQYIWVPCALVIVAAVLAAVLPPPRYSWLLLPFFAWQFFHFQRQNLGMSALAARITGVATPGRFERAGLTLSAIGGILGLVTRPHLLGLRVGSATELGHTLAGVAFLAGVGLGVIALRQRLPAQRSLGFCVVFLTSLLFFVPSFVFGSPYAAVAGMTIGHGMQYLLLVGLVAAGRRDRQPRLRGPTLLGNVAILGGIILATASHQHSGPPAVRLLFGAYVGAVMAHFVVDAGLWRLRDPFPRQFLTERVPYLLGPVRPPSARLTLDRQTI